MDIEPSAPAPDVETPAAPIEVGTPTPADVPAEAFDLDAFLTTRADTLAANEADNARRALDGPDYADKAAM